MKKIVLAAAVAFSVSGCLPTAGGVGSIPASPRELSQRTVADEKARLGLELAYEAYGIAIDMIPVTRSNAAALQELDVTVHAAVLEMRAAYAAANSSSWIAAASRFESVLRGALSEARRMQSGN